MTQRAAAEKLRTIAPKGITPIQRTQHDLMLEQLSLESLGLKQRGGSFILQGNRTVEIKTLRCTVGAAHKKLQSIQLMQAACRGAQVISPRNKTVF